MTILDSFAVIALLRGEPAAKEVRGLIVAGGARLTAIGVGEVIDHLVRVVGVLDEEATLDVAQLGLQDAIEVDAGVASRSGLLRARHYHRTTRAVSLADCVAAATAHALGADLATADPHLLDLCHEEGIRMIPLPDTEGRRWSPERAGG